MLRAEGREIKGEGEMEGKREREKERKEKRERKRKDFRSVREEQNRI